MIQSAEKLIRCNIRFARIEYTENFSKLARTTLKALTRQFGFSLELGDVLLLDGSWYVTHSGLLRLATRRGLQIPIPYAFRSARLTARVSAMRISAPRTSGETLRGALRDLQIHHIRFRSHQGGTAEDNLITLCASCHSQIHNEK